MNENLIEEDENEIIKDKGKTFQNKNLPLEQKEEQSFLNETLVDTIMDGEYPISNIDIKDYNIRYKYFYELIISFILFINSFISYSLMNIFHIFYSYYILYTSYSTCYSFKIKFKKIFGIFIILIDSLYLFFKAAIHLFINGKKEKSKEFEDTIYKKIFILFNDWRTIYDYIIISIIIIILFINSIIKHFDHEYFNNNELIHNIRIIEKYLKNSNEILSIGALFLCFGSTICPSIINLVFLILGLIFFSSLYLTQNCKASIRKYLKHLFLIMILVYSIYNYILSFAIVEENILKTFNTDKIPYYFGIIKPFESNTEKKNEYTINVYALFHFLFFYFSFYFINSHNKCLDYINNTQENVISVNTSYINDKDINSLIEFNKEIEDVAIEEGELLNTRTISLTGSFVVNKEKTKMQALFDSDLDCAIIVFLKETQKYHLKKKIRLFLSKFCYTPGFSLHICRIGFIYWICCFNIFYESYFIIIWLLFSIKYSANKCFLLFTKYVIYPFLIAIFFLSYVTNIIVNQKIFEIPPEASNLNKFLHTTTKLIIVYIFQMFIYLNEQYLRNLRDQEIKEGIRKQQKDIQKKIEQDFKGIYVLKPIEVFFKLYFILIDFFVIAFFYLSLSQKINLFNNIVLFCIIAFLIISQNFKKHLYICLWILTISFLLKYTIYILQIKNSTFKLIVDLIFNDDLDKIYYYWISYYLLFLEYIGQTSKLFKICKSKRFSVYEIIEYNLSSYTYIKFILNTLFSFIFGIYIWLLIPCFLFSLLIHDNNCISLFQLTIVFIIYYKYIKIVNIKFKSDHKIYRYTITLIFTNIFNLIIEYILQIFNNQIFLVNLYLYYPKKTIFYKMELIGFFLFKSNYSSNLLSFFMTFILSLALHVEIKRQHSINTKDSVIKTELEKYSFINAINKFSSVRNELENSEMTKLNEKEAKQQKIEKIEKKLKENQKTKKIVQKLFTVLYYLLHYYWIIIFFFVAILSIHWMLSISMIIELSIFSFYMGKSFNGYYNCLKSQDYLNKNGVKNYNKLTLNQKIKLYQEEKKQHFKITSQTQHNYYSLIWIFTFSFIILSYLNSLILKYLNITESNSTIIKYISAIAYFLGVYSEPQNEINNYDFWSYTWGYFVIIGLFSIRTYFMSKFAEIKVMYFNENQSKNRVSRTFSKSSKESRQSKLLEIVLIENINKMDDLDINNSFDMNFYDNTKMDFFNDGNETELFNSDKSNKMISLNIINNKDFSNNDSNPQKNNNNLFIRMEKHEKMFAKRFKGNYFKHEYIEFINEEKKFHYCQDDININYKKNIINKNFENSVSFQIGLKKTIEIIIVILLFVNALIKCNILSFIFLLILIPTYRLKFINIHLMFRVSFIILFLLIIQYAVFTSNLSYITNPFINKEIILNVSQIFHIPWYKDYRWSTFFSLGTNRYQIISIWLDVTIIIILYFYLEYFSFTIYREEDTKLELKIVNKKYFTKFKALNSISPSEFRSFIRAMKVSYNIELKPSFVTKTDKNIEEYIYKTYNKYVLKLLYLFKGDKRILAVRKNSKTKNLIKIRGFFYISFQYLFLIMTLLISSFNQGLIGFGYMSFSVFYIYKSHCFLKGRRWTILNGIYYFMKPFLFLDILSQFIFQIPFDKYKKNKEQLEIFFKYFGYVNIADYSSQTDFISGVSCFIVILKILCYFLLLIQEKMYTSFAFQKFILKYHYEYLQKAYIKGKLHSFLFNNHRVRLMNDRNKENRRVQRNLLNIEKTVNNWNIKVRRYNATENLENKDNMYDIPNNQSMLSKKDKGITVRKILRKHWLISLTMRIFEASNSIDDEHFNVAGYILKILKGNYVLYSDLDNLINKYEEENFEKYNDISKVKKLLDKYLNRNNKNKSKSIQNPNMVNQVANQLRRKSSSILPIYNNNLVKFNLIDKNINGDIKEEYEEKLNSNIGAKLVRYNSCLNESEDDSSSDTNIKEEDNNKNNKMNKNYTNITNKNIINKKSINIRNNYNKYIKLDQPYDDMFFPHSDYRDLKRLIRQDFFKKYCSRKKIFLILIKSTWDFLYENNEYIIYFFLLINHIISGSIISLIYPLFVLIFGIIQYPRPSKLFWKTLMVYTTFIIFLKFFIQLNVWEMLNFTKNAIAIFDKSNENFISFLGLNKIPNHDFLLFMIYIIPDFFVLLLLIINQVILIRKGLWYIMETDYEKIEEANDRIILYNSKIITKKIGFDENNSKILTTNEILKLIGKAKEEKKYGIIRRMQRFHQKNFTKLRNEKPGKDFYTYYTIVQIIILIYIIFFYTKMERDSIVYNASAFKLKQFSGNMVIFAFIHVFILVFDRFLYLKNARKLKRISYKIFDKNTGEDITSKFQKYKFEEVLELTENKNKISHDYEVVSFQFEDTQLGLLLKYITQIVLVIFIHIFIYFYLPTKNVISSDEGTQIKNLDISENKVTTNIFIFIFYILYIIYFIFSGLQIKYGLTDMRKVSSLMKASNLFYNMTYKVYKQIPFLFELKNFIDWTFTSTALDLWKWLKLEEIISLLFINKCLGKGNLKRRVGSLSPLYMKILMGGTMYFCAIMLIFGPLILFSSLNPINMVNSVNGINLKIVLCMNIEQSTKINLTLYHTSNAIIKSFDSDEDYSNYLKEQNNSELQNFNKSYNFDQVQKVKLLGFSEHKWDISYQLKNYFNRHNNYSDGEYFLSLIYAFTTVQNSEADSNYKYEKKYIIDEEIMTNLSNTIISNESNIAILSLKEFYYPYQRIMENNVPNPIVFNVKKNVTLILEKKNLTNDKFSYNWFLKDEKQDLNINEKSDDFEGIEFLTFTDLYSVATFGYDVITFYITFILVSEQLIRAIFMGQAERIIYTEMVNPSRLFSVCEGIKISRIRKNYLQEEKLYYLLIDMMRSPEIIKNVTQSSLIYLQESNTVRKENKNMEFEVESMPIIKKRINRRLI